MSVRAMYCACIIVFIRKVYNKYSVWYLCTLENYKVTHLLKGFPRYGRIRKRTQIPVRPLKYH